MRILGIDTSTKFLCIGAFDGLKIYEYRLNLGIGHDIFLIEHIQRVLMALKIELKDLDYLAVGIGPGSFTGLRIGLSTIKGLGLVINKKIIDISTLDIIAYNALESDRGLYICPILDARRGFLYTTLYKKDNFSLKRLFPYRLLKINDLIKMVPQETIFLGDGLNLYKQTIGSEIKNSIILDEDFFWPRGTNIIRLAVERIKKNRFTAINKIKPIYLYPKECQVWKSLQET
jgi:tRNA threonylcarbamoyladenosine biosynthesis protein TsaB